MGFMWWRLFSSERPKEAPPGYDELADRLDRLERHEKMMELEWESVYNKLRSLLARMNKRDERAADSATNGEGQYVGPGGPGIPAARSPDEIDRIIALRRGRR